ncbi:MAG: DUF6615 family protein [Caldilineaceae bacterium]
MSFSRQQARNNLCHAAQKNTSWLWNTLRKARKFNHKLGEESLTDFFVLNFRQWSPPQFTITTFTRHQEAANGSDWEWWFGTPGRNWLGMRIQAKVINLSTHCYDHLHYAPKGKAQVDRLITDAQRCNLLPLYCLYTNWDTKQHRLLRAPAHRTEYGANLLAATHVKRNSRKQTGLVDYFRYMTPLAQLFCIGANANTEFATAILNNAMQRQLLDQSSNLQSLLRRQPPPYVSELLESTEFGGFEDVGRSVDLSPTLNNDLNLRSVTIFAESNNE